MWKWLAASVPALAILVAQLPLDQGLISLVRDLGVVAVLVWYVMYDMRVRTPAMLKTFTDEQAATRQAFREEQAQNRVTFAAEQAAQRAHYDAQLARYQEMLFRSVNETSKAVKEFKDSAQVVSNQAGIIVKTLEQK